MGLFQFGKEKKKAEAEKEKAYQKDLQEKVTRAEEKFKSDGDLDAVISELEYAFIIAEPPCRSDQNMDLASYYIKAGRSAEAWVYLDHLYAINAAPLQKIRFEQAKMLTSEGRWADMIEMYMLAYLAKAKEEGCGFDKDSFLRDIRQATRKLWLSPAVVEEITRMLSTSIKKKNYKEAELVDQYRKYYTRATKSRR